MHMIKVSNLPLTAKSAVHGFFASPDYIIACYIRNSLVQSECDNLSRDQTCMLVLSHCLSVENIVYASFRAEKKPVPVLKHLLRSCKNSKLRLCDGN